MESVDKSELIKRMTELEKILKQINEKIDNLEQQIKSVQQNSGYDITVSFS